MVELNGLTLGILGYGNIGKAVAKIALGFGMKVIFHTPHPPDNLPENIVPVDLETLFRNSDVLSLHCPLTDETHKIVNAERLAKMKSSALLINTSRGQLIDEAALRNALNSERIAGAGLDVLDIEPPKSGHPLFGAKIASSRRILPGQPVHRASDC
ncbi:MAG: NAD(P)-dependent oxidoreductase [Calditrichia bacterium]